MSSLRVVGVSLSVLFAKAAASLSETLHAAKGGQQCLGPDAAAAVKGFDGPWSFQAGLNDKYAGYHGSGGCNKDEKGCLTCRIQCGSFPTTVPTAQIVDVEPVALSVAEVAVLSKVAGYPLPALRGRSTMTGFKGTFLWSGPAGEDHGLCPRGGSSARMTSYWWREGNSLLSFVQSESSWQDAGGLHNSTQQEVWTWQYAN